MNREEMKQAAALAALDYISEDSIVGVGTGSTANYFIEALASIKHKIEATVASSVVTEKKLKSLGMPVIDLNSASRVAVYVDGTDEVNDYLQLIKGGGGAHTREKIIATVAEKFVCIADQGKKVDVLGQFPLPIEIIPMARSYVGRQLVRLGADPEYRQGFITDNGNIILDVRYLDFSQPIHLEQTLNNITGVVSVGLFAMRSADVLLLGTDSGVQTYLRK